MEIVCKIWGFEVENWRHAPPFKKSKKIVKNRRFSENGWPKSKSNTGNGFPGVDYIYLDTSYVPIKVYFPGGWGEVPREWIPWGRLHKFRHLI